MVGIIIVSVCSLVPCFIGYEMVHTYERYAWIVMTIVMFFLWGLGGHAGFDINAQKPLEATGRALSGDILSYGGIIFGSFSGVRSTSTYSHIATNEAILQWAPVAADYNCRLPVDASSMKVFLLTFFGLWIPICFVEILGATLMTISDPAFADVIAAGDTGGLLAQVLSPWKGGGKFILVVLAFSIV